MRTIPHPLSRELPLHKGAWWEGKPLLYNVVVFLFFRGVEGMAGALQYDCGEDWD